MKIGRLEINVSIAWEGDYMPKVRAALRRGAKLEAIRIYKDATGRGLIESKEAIEKLCPRYLKDYKEPEFDFAKFQASQFNK
jgi:ribosomal protein L7/L12